MVSGRVRVTTVDEDHQEVVVDEPSHGEFFGFASMLEQTPHQTSAVALDETECLELDRHDIMALLQKSPTPAWTCSPCLAVNSIPRSSWSASRQSQSQRIDRKKATFGERIADSVADSAAPGPSSLRF